MFVWNWIAPDHFTDWEGTSGGPVDSHHQHQTWQTGISLPFPWLEPGADGRSKREFEQNSGRRVRGRVGGGPERERGREARSGVDRRGDMLRYGSGRTVSTTTTTTTTTEDSPESLSEVRSPRDSGHWNYPSVSPLFTPPSFLYFANSPVFFSPTLLCLSLVAFNSVATCFLLVFLNFPS